MILFIITQNLDYEIIRMLLVQSKICDPKEYNSKINKHRMK